MIMKTSATLLLTNFDVVLFCHPYGADNYTWSLPKGIIDENETPLEACIREVKEETSLDISKYVLKDIGFIEYLKNKNLHLFILKVNILPEINTLKCFSNFIGKDGKEYPEVDNFMYVAFSNLRHYISLNLYNAIGRVARIVTRS